ncbi:MAG TPA: dual specificity protein phosphatase [Chloroflexaceae bacterium]|nr:dual specificity protein phosphatase [Chloroflexaceae bacterium]
MITYVGAQWRRFFGLNISRVEPLLFVGGQFRAEQWPLLRALGVRAVLSMQAERPDSFAGEPPERALRLLVPDFTPPTLAQLAEGVTFIEEAHGAGQPVFVHCHAGVGRAPIMAAAYLVASRRIGHLEALDHVRRARPIIGPSPAQVARLREFERQAR